MKELEKYSTDVLENEIKKRNSIIPPIIDEPNFDDLKELCKQYMQDVEKYGWGVWTSFPRAIFIEAIKAFYGKGVTKFL